MELWNDRVMELSSYVVMGLTGFDYMGFERTLSNNTHDFLY